MAIHRNEIPLLEYDDQTKAVINADHENLNLHLPRRAVFAFLGEEIDQYAKDHGARIVSYFESTTKNYPLYILDVNGEEICLIQAPAGAPAAVQIMEWLISYGVTSVISAGSCGVLSEMEENVFLVPKRALRDEGTSYHYLPPSRFVEVSETARAAIQKALSSNHLSHREITTWTTDGFFRETEEKVRYRLSEGCETVEMECAALSACAQMRRIQFGQILYTADSLADPENYDARDWGRDSAVRALKLCIEALMYL